MNRLFLLLTCGLTLLVSAMAQTGNNPGEGGKLTRTGAERYTFSWQAHAGRFYFLQYSEDLVHWSYFPDAYGDTVLDEIFEYEFSVSGRDRYFVRVKYLAPYTGDPLTQDPDGDNVNTLDELGAGTDPFDFYNGVLPVLTIVASPPSIGEINQVLNQPFEVRVNATVGGPILANAPVTLSAFQVSSLVQPSVSPSLVAPNWSTAFDGRTTTGGIASAYLRLSSSRRITTIVATAHSGSLTRSVSINVRPIQFSTPVIDYLPVSSAPNGVTGIQTDRHYLEIATHEVPLDVLWVASTLPSDPLLNITRSTSNPSVCIPNNDTSNPQNRFFWVAVGNGEADITMAVSGSGPNTETITHTEHVVLQPRDRITRQYGSLVSGSPAAHCAAEIDSRIAGKGSANLPLFSHVDHANAQYTWSTATDNAATRCWAHDFDLTCMPVWSSAWENGGGPYRLGCLVTPRIVLVANHFQPLKDTFLRFVTKANEVVTRKVIDFVSVGPNPYQYNMYAPEFDLGFVVLEAAVPPTITPAKILGSVTRLGVKDSEFSDAVPWGVPCLGINQQLEAFVQDAAYQHAVPPATTKRPDLFFAWQNSTPTNTQRFAMHRFVNFNDSSKPCFLIAHGKPVLVTLWTFGDDGSGVAVQQFLNLPNPVAGISNLVTRMAEYRAAHPDADDANWQLNLETFSDFPPF